MSNDDFDDERITTAEALRNLGHAFIAYEAEPATLRALAQRLDAEAALLQQGERRDRLALMQAARQAAGNDIGGLMAGRSRTGFEDRAVAGRANPMAIDFAAATVPAEPDPSADIVVEVVLRKAFEGAPGRAHGGMVAAAFDDVTGWVIGRLGEPAFTGELTVRFLAPVPVEQPLVVRTRLTGRERRKLFITAEMSAGDEVVATCRAIYITVDPSLFAGAPDPR